jgi:imidazoleglycerol-phosphate dehydratase
MKERKAKMTRLSKETGITVELSLDGKGKTKIQSPIGLLNHMLTLMAFHGCLDLNIIVSKADTDIDIHHTNEDIAIVLGKAFADALGTKAGIRRFGFGIVPMESTLGQTVVDICGRPHFNGQFQPTRPENQDGYSMTHCEHFLESLAKGLGATINVKITNPSDDLHTNLETVFKSLGLALRSAVEIDPRRKGIVPSTKGIID